YVSARSALLTTVFYLAAFDAGARDRRVVAVLLGACAMLTKSIALTLPVAVLLHRVLAPPYRRRPIPWGFIGSLALVAAAGILYRWWLLPPWVVESARQPGVTSWTYFITEWSALVYYLRLFVWPDALVVDRVDYPAASSLWDVQGWGSLLALAGLGVRVWLFARRRRAFAFAALGLVVTLAPESSFFPLAEPVNEHRPYLAMLGMATLAALWLWLAAGTAARRLAAPAPWPFAVVVTFVVTLLGATTHARNEVWRGGPPPPPPA